jgi:hypothetical protein
MVKEYYRVKESNKGQFTGVIMNYHVWRRRFIVTVHSQWRPISDKEKALSTAIDSAPTVPLSFIASSQE